MKWTMFFRGNDVRDSTVIQVTGQDVISACADAMRGGLGRMYPILIAQGHHPSKQVMVQVGAMEKNLKGRYSPNLDRVARHLITAVYVLRYGKSQDSNKQERRFKSFRHNPHVSRVFYFPLCTKI